VASVVVAVVVFAAALQLDAADFAVGGNRDGNQCSHDTQFVYKPKLILVIVHLPSTEVLDLGPETSIL
jgi:hypothetical protein